MGGGSNEFFELGEDLVLGCHEVDVHEMRVIIDEQDKVALVVDGLHVERATDVGMDHGHGPVHTGSRPLTNGHALELALNTGQAVAKVINNGGALEVSCRPDHANESLSANVAKAMVHLSE